MFKKNYSDLSNSELKLHMECMENLFESKKNELKQICELMAKVENEYLSAKKELEMRKNILL